MCYTEYLSDVMPMPLLFRKLQQLKFLNKCMLSCT